MTHAIRPQPGIMEIALYQGGASHAEGFAEPLKLSSNENPFGPSEAARAAFARSAATLHRYPPSDHARLRAAIGEVHGLDPRGSSAARARTRSSPSSARPTPALATR